MSKKLSELISEKKEAEKAKFDENLKTSEEACLKVLTAIDIGYQDMGFLAPNDDGIKAKRIFIKDGEHGDVQLILWGHEKVKYQITRNSKVGSKIEVEGKIENGDTAVFVDRLAQVIAEKHPECEYD